MIQELLEKHKDNMCKESHSYRLRRIAYLELIEIINPIIYFKKTKIL